MNEKADLIFGVDTSEAVGNLNRLSKALQGVYDQMGKGSANPSRALAKNTEEMSAAARTAQVEFDELARKANEAARVMVSSSRKIGDAYVSIRSEATSSAEAIKKWERALEEAANNPETVAGYERQKRQIKDLADYNERVQRQMTDAWHKELDRRNKLAAQKDKELENYNKAVQNNMTELYHKELHRRSEAVRKEKEKQLAYQRDLELNMQSLVAREMKRRADYAKGVHDNMTQAYVAELRRREQAEREHQNTMARLEREAWNRKKRRDAEKIAYLSRSSASQLQILEEINLLSNQGVRTSALARRFGSFAVTQPRTEEALAALRKEVEAQRAVEAAERALNKERSKSESLLNKNTQAILRNNQAMADARGLARGLSGALGTLWMTYGAIGPLLTGAALGSIARQTYQIGKDVEYRLAVIEALGNRAIKISEMMPAVHGSMKTPLEAAEGLQVLAQAGLNADESLAVLSTTLQLATLGEMSVAEAALTATAALSTFHLGVDEAARVGDVFAKTASVSNTTVKGIAEAMKQAGSAASIYGVTLEETSAQIAILAQNGIRGSAAGTAVRNAMTELHAPTEKARKLMEEFGIEMYKEGNISRNYMSVLEDLRSVYYSLDEAGQNALLKGMFNERSRRAIQIFMKDLDGLKQLYGEITDSQLFLLDANLRLLNTVEGASNRMSSVFQQTLVDSFDNLRPHILSTIRSLEELFGSGGFQRTVQTIGGAVARLTEGLANHAGKISTVLGLYATWRIAMGLAGASYSALIGWKERGNLTTTKTVAALELETRARERNTRATVANAAATASATSRWLSVGLAATRVLNILGLAAIAISAGASLWNSWRASTEKADESQKTLAPTLDQVIRSLKEQNKELEKNIKLQNERARGVPEGTSNFEVAKTNAETELYAAQARHAAIQVEIQALRQKYAKQTEPGSRDVVFSSDTLAQITKLGVESDKLAKIILKNNGKIIESQEELDEVRRKSREQEAGRIHNTIQDLIKEATLRVKYGRNVSDQYKKGVADIIAYDEAFQASGQKSLEEMEAHLFKVREMSNAIQIYLNSFDINALDGWIKSQREAEEGSRGLAAAVARGTEAVTKYTIEQAALKQTTEFTQESNEDYEDVLRRVIQALWDAHYAESSLNAARQISNIQEKTRDLQEQLVVLRAYTKGAKEFAKAEEELAYNRGLRQVLEGVAPGEQSAVAMTYLLEWEKYKAAEDAVKTQEAINRAYTEGLTPLEQYLQKKKELNDLYEKATTDEDREIVTKRLIKLEEDYQKSLNKGGGRAARQIERLDVWIAKKYAEAEATKDLTKAYLEGEASLLEYNIQKEASVKAQEYAKRGSEEYKKIVEQITEAVRTLNVEEARLEIAKQVNDLNKQTKASDDYVKVLLAQSKGYKQGEDALKAFNKEQARTALLANLSADNLEEVLDILAEFDAAYDRNEASEDRNKKLGDLNDLINQTKNSTQKYREEMERLERLRLPEASPEQLAALEQHMRNVTIEANDFLSTLNQGFIDLNQNANDMWRKFLEDGKFSMDSVKSMFRKMLADLAHQALTKPIIISVQNAVMGTNIGGGWGDVWGGSGGTGGVGGVGGLLGVANTVKSGWDLFSGGMTSKVGGLIGNLGQKFGSSAMTSFANGMLGTFGSTAASSVGATIGSSALASMSTSVGTGAIANVAYSSTIGTTMGTAGAAANMGAMAGAALPWIGAAVAAFSMGKMIHNMFKGETRSGGGFWRDSATGQTHFGGGPSGGYGGQKTLTTMDQVLAGFSDSVTGLFDALKINADLIRTTASFESSDKGRGGTSSGGTLIIDGQTLHFGSVNQDGGVVKGKGYGGTSGSVEEMFENMTKDMAFSTLEAWKLAGDRLPNILAKAFEGKEIRQMSAEQASELVAYIQNVVVEVNQAIEALNKLPFKNLTNLTFDLTASLMEAAGGVSNFSEGLNSYYTNFYTEMERGEHATKLLEEAMAELGLALPPTRKGFRDLVDSLDALDEANHTTIAGLLNLSAAASEHYDRIGDSLEKLNGQIESTVLGTFQNLSSELNRLFSIRNTGHNLADRIAGQLGRDPLNAAKREAELWSQINKGTAEQQISMAEELLGLINARHALELKRNDKLVESIKEQLEGMRKMLELSISLRDYIHSLETSDLSPNTLRQKVAIAEADLISQIEKAREGDEDAMGEVQGSLEKALRLWREYGASGQAYQDTYYRLTKMAEDLALGNINSLDPETRRLEQQLETLQKTKALNEYQLAELENLYNLTESANSKIEDLYEQTKWGLEQEALQLEKIGLNTEQLTVMRDLLATLPSDIAANLSPLLDRTIEATVEGWYQSGFGTGSDPAGKAYWVDRVQNEGITRPKEDFDRIANQYPNVRKDVTYWYENFLGRKPEPEGLEFWVNEILLKGQDQAFTDFMGHVNGSHRNGLDYVPYDGYVAELHKGERVLTAHENERYARVGINSNDDILRELQQLRQEVAENTRAVIDMGGHQIRASQQAAEQTSRIIVTGVGSAIRERSRDDIIRSNSMRKGIL